MRKFGVVLLCLLLCGCTVSENKIKNQINDVLVKIESEEAITETNMRRTYFDYFLPRNVGHRFSDQENAVFLLNDQAFYMNLDISEIIISEYYSPLLSTQQKRFNEIAKIGTNLVRKSGEMLDSSNVMQKYKIVLSKIDNHEYFLYTQYGDVYFSAICPLSNVEELIYEMFKIGRSVRIDGPKVLRAYSNKETVIITKEYDLFEKVFPENGVVYDVLHPIDNVNVGDTDEDSSTIIDEEDIEQDEDSE